MKTSDYKALKKIHYELFLILNEEGVKRERAKKERERKQLEKERALKGE